MFSLLLTPYLNYFKKLCICHNVYDYVITRIHCNSFIGSHLRAVFAVFQNTLSWIDYVCGGTGGSPGLVWGLEQSDWPKPCKVSGGLNWAALKTWRWDDKPDTLLSAFWIGVLTFILSAGLRPRLSSSLRGLNPNTFGGLYNKLRPVCGFDKLKCMIWICWT